VTSTGRIGQRLARLDPARAAAALLLGIVGALMLLMVASVFHAMRFDTAATQPINLGQWEQSPLPLRAPLPLSEAPGLWLLRGDVSLHNARIKEQPRPSTETIDGPFATPLHSVERIVISGARLWLNAGREPRGTSLAPENAAIYHLLEPLQRLAFETLTLQGASLTTQRLAGGQQTIERLDAEIRAAPGRGATSASGRFQYRGEQVEFEASLQPVVTRLGRWEVPARITATSRHLSIAFDGLVQFESGLRLAGRLDLRAPSLAALSQWLGFALPDGVDGRSFSAKGNASWREGVLAFENVVAELDGQIAQGALSIALAGPRPFLDGALTFDRLDAVSALTWFGLAPPRGGLPEQQTAPIGRRPARIAIFDSIDADLRLSALQLLGFGGPPGRMAVSVIAKAGLVIADIADLEIANGSGWGQLTVDQRGEVPNYRLQGSVNRAEAAQLLGMLQMPDLLTGRTNLRFELAGRGHALGDSAIASTGTIHINILGSGRMQIDTAALLADARGRKSFAFSTHQRRDSEFDQFEALLAIRQGTIMTEHVAVRREGAVVTADGAVQVRAGRVYFRLLADHGQGLARTARLGRSQSVLIHGEMGNPTVLLEESAATQSPATAGGPPPVPQAR
jgi:AsmA protein